MTIDPETRKPETANAPEQSSVLPAGAREIPVEHRGGRREVTVFRVIGEPRRACASRGRGYRYVVRGGRRMPA